MYSGSRLSRVPMSNRAVRWIVGRLGEQPSYKKKIELYLGDIDRKVRVQIIRTSDDKIIYDKKQNPSEGKIEIILEDKGKQNYAIWIDNEYFMTRTLNFTEKERGDE